jgi:hypothetical protein
MSRARPGDVLLGGSVGPGRCHCVYARSDRDGPTSGSLTSRPAEYRTNPRFPCLRVYLRASAPVREVTDYLCVYSTLRHAQNA